MRATAMLPKTRCCLQPKELELQSQRGSDAFVKLAPPTPRLVAPGTCLLLISSKIQFKNTVEKYISRNTLCSPWQLAGGDHTRSLLSHHQLSSVKTQARKSSESLDQIICEVIFILKIFLTLDVYLCMIIDHPLDSHSCSCIPTLQWRIRKY